MIATQTGSSSARLARLIEMRLANGADKSALDQRIWNTFGEQWTVMFTDLTGFSRRSAEFGIIHFLQTIYESERLFIPKIEEHDGILLKSEGDSLFVIFRSLERAITCSVEMQRSCKNYNLDRGDAEKILLCVGIGHGLVLKIGDSDVFGSEVNAASKLGEDLAKSGDIFLTGAARKAATNQFKFEALAGDAPSGTDSAHRLIYTL